MVATAIVSSGPLYCDFFVSSSPFSFSSTCAFVFVANHLNRPNNHHFYYCRCRCRCRWLTMTRISCCVSSSFEPFSASYHGPSFDAWLGDDYLPRRRHNSPASAAFSPVAAAVSSRADRHHCCWNSCSSFLQRSKGQWSMDIKSWVL